MLTYARQESRRRRRPESDGCRAQVSTKVQRLTSEASTKVQILTPEAGRRCSVVRALLVQKRFASTNTDTGGAAVAQQSCNRLQQTATELQQLNTDSI